MLTQSDIAPLVALALSEDIGSGDITAALVGAEEQALATVITRESGVLCGTQFVDAVFAAVDASLEIIWQSLTATHSCLMTRCLRCQARAQHFDS